MSENAEVPLADLVEYRPYGSPRKEIKVTYSALGGALAIQFEAATVPDVFKRVHEIELMLAKKPAEDE